MLSTKKSHHNFWDEKLPIFSSVLLFGFYMVFEGSLQQALHRVTFKRILRILKSRNAGCWLLSKNMDEQCVAIKIVAMQFSTNSLFLFPTVLVNLNNSFVKAISLHLFFTLEQSGLIVIGFFLGL